MVLVPLLAAALSAAPVAAPAAPAPFALRDGDRVVFYGDSITQDGAYALFVEEYVRTRFPTWDVRFYNAGVGGDTVRGGGAGPIDVRLARDVIALEPTVVTVMLGMNDGGYKRFDPTTLSAFADGYRAIAERLRRERPEARLTFIRSSPFDDVSRPPQFAPGYDDALRRLGCYVEQLGGQVKARVVDFRESVNAGLAAVVAKDPELAKQLVPDRVHPGPAGHLVMGATLLRAWSAPGLVSRVAIDAAAAKVAASERATITDLTAAGGGIAWSQKDESLPLPLNFDDATVDLAQKAGADLDSLDEQTLAVTGLAPGPYELKVDGRAVASATADELARGLNLARYNTPMRWQAFSVRWSAQAGHDLQVLRRGLLVDAAKDPSAQSTADALAVRDDREQKARSGAATPKPHRFEVVPVR
jgi:lysophospholipase L1-like esterase